MGKVFLKEMNKQQVRYEWERWCATKASQNNTYRLPNYFINLVQFLVCDFLEKPDNETEYVEKRRRLPNRRKGETFKFKINGHKIFLRTGFYEDGTLGEIFLDNPKEGSALRSNLHVIAILISIGLQYGVPISEFSKTLHNFKYEPNGIVEDVEGVTECNSIIDCVLKILEKNYSNK